MTQEYQIINKHLLILTNWKTSKHCITKSTLAQILYGSNTNVLILLHQHDVGGGDVLVTIKMSILTLV